MMLDLAGLPKNVNGFRTTHTCELCGFEPKTKNKYREKQDHLVMKHFKEKIDRIFPHCRPYSCPAECGFTGKDKQALLRHYTGKHGILERYLREALAEKGITYLPGEGGKRRSSSNSNNSDSSNGKSKNPRLSPPSEVVVTAPVATVIPAQTAAISKNNKSSVIPKPNTAELRKEVEAMMASFQPVEQPVVLHINGSSTNAATNGTATVNGTSAPVVVTAIPVIEAITQPAADVSPSSANGTTTIVTNATTGGQPTVIPVSSLPAIVLSAVANATAASVQAKAQAAAIANGGVTTNGHTVQSQQQKSSITTATTTTASILANGTVTAPGEKQATFVPTITVNAQQTTTAAAAKASQAIGSLSSSNPLPIEVIKGSTVVLNGDKSRASPVVENEDVMWSASANGPAVIVESAVPVTYIDAADAANLNLENIEYDYLYQAAAATGSSANGSANVVGNTIEVRERQLDFCML